MKLSVQERENLCTLANAVIRGSKEGLPEEVIAERYSLMYSAVLAYGSDLVNICQMYDRAEYREDGAGLILMLNYGPTYSGTIPEDLPEGRSVIHETFGVGEVHVNKVVKSSSPGTSCLGKSADFRMIAIEFFDGVHWMKPDEQYLAIITPEETCTT